jgi:hypothetical protein
MKAGQFAIEYSVCDFIDPAAGLAYIARPFYECFGL